MSLVVISHCVLPRRLSEQKRGTRRRRSGAVVSGTRRPTRTRTARVSGRRMHKRAGVMSGASARAFFDASRWHHSPDLGVPDQLSSYTPIKGVTRKAVTAPTGLGAAYYIFVWTPSQVRCVWISHEADDVDGYFRVHFPFVAWHSQAAGPSMIRPLRQSVAFCDISSSQDVNARIILCILKFKIIPWPVVPVFAFVQTNMPRSVR